MEHTVVVEKVPDSGQAEVIACLEVYSIQSDNPPNVEVDKTYVGAREKGLRGGRQRGKKAIVTAAIESRRPAALVPNSASLQDCGPLLVKRCPGLFEATKEAARERSNALPDVRLVV